MTAGVPVTPERGQCYCEDDGDTGEPREWAISDKPRAVRAEKPNAPDCSEASTLRVNQRRPTSLAAFDTMPEVAP